MTASEGYQCEFIDQVPEDFYCKKCNLVARRLTLTKCCEESYCYACIDDLQSEGKPCPACGEKELSTFQLKKYIRRLNSLNVYCSMKERGCVWFGSLDQLDTHLDPHLDNCQYVDTKCPLNCLQTVPKNKVDHHVAQECSKRPHVCQHCGFKATYEEVVDTHLPECKYVILQCPNKCGVSCEREVMEDHMKTCRLEAVVCEFSNVGCDGRFIREDQDEHIRQNSQKHLSLTAFLAVETKEQFQQKLLELDKKHKEEEEKLKKRLEDREKKLGKQEKKLGEQEKKLGEQEKKLGEQEKKLGEQKKKLGEQEKKLGEQEKRLGEQEKKLGEQEKKLWEQEKKLWEQDEKLEEVEKKLAEKFNFNLKLLKQTLSNRQFVMENFSIEKAIVGKQSDWKSPAMYTHLGGYKFCVGVDATGRGVYGRKCTDLNIWSMPGEFDDNLNWPAKAKFTVEIIHQQGGANFTIVKMATWNKSSRYCLMPRTHCIDNSIVNSLLYNDSLLFVVSKVEVF